MNFNIKNLESPHFPLLAGLAIVSAIGLSFGLHAMIAGHHHTLNTTREVPWGILITPYVFFACLSTGLCIVASVSQVFRIEKMQPIIPRIVFLAIVSMATGLMCISLELENPWRVGLNAFLSPHPSSNIWWKTAIYSLYLIFMVFNFLALLLKDTKKARIFSIVTIVTVTMGNLNMNSDMAIMGSRGFWSENYMPLYFLSLSVLTGCATILLFSWLARRLNGWKEDINEDVALQTTGKVFMGLLLGILYFTIVKIMGGYAPSFTKNPEAMFLLVQGDFSFNFWVGEVALAVIIPLALILACRGKQVTALALAGTSCLIGSFILFYDLVIVGQLIPHFHEYNVVGLPEYYPYTPSLHEIMITGGAVFFFLAAFVLGEILLKIKFTGHTPQN